MVILAIRDAAGDRVQRSGSAIEPCCDCDEASPAESFRPSECGACRHLFMLATTFLSPSRVFPLDPFRNGYRGSFATEQLALHEHDSDAFSLT